MNKIKKEITLQRLDWIPLPNINKRILCISHCPGKTDSNEKEEKIYHDLRILKKKSVQTIISLISSEEIEQLGLNSLFSLIEKFEFEHIHFPIKDRTVPENKSDFEKIVLYLVKKISKGNVINIHCNAGLGRSGLLAALICKNMKVSLDPIEYIRKFRQGSIETIDQEEMIKSLFN